MIRLAVAGTSSFGLPSFARLFSAPGISIAAVVSQPDRPVGRHQMLTPTAVSAWAEANHLPLLTPLDWKNPTDLQRLSDLHLDGVVVAAYGIIVPPAFLALPRRGCLNIHASLLPRHRGASPIAAAILAGDEETGITFMEMDAGVDTGPIFSSVPYRLQPDDTTSTVTTSLADIAAAHIVPMVTQWIDGSVTATPQSGEPSYAKKITRDDGRADWSSAEVLERKTRAYESWPGLWSRWQGVNIKFLRGRAWPDRHREQPGSIVHLQGKQWGIVCRQGIFEPLSVQFEGKRPQDALSIPGSYPGWLGSRLEA